MAEQKVIIDIEINTKDIKAAGAATEKAGKEVLKYQKELNRLKEEQKTINALQKEGKLTTTEYAKAQVAIKTAVDAAKKSQREANKTLIANKTVVDAASGSNTQMKARLALLTKEYNSLSKNQRENTKAGKKQEATINALTTKLKANEKAVGDNRRNVGNYSEAIEKAAGNINIMGVNVGGMVSKLKANKAALKANTEAQVAGAAATGVGTGALKLFKLALAATGIGLLIVALGSLVAFFTKTKRGVEVVDRAMAGISATFSVLTDRASALGEGLINVFKNPQESIKKLGEFIKSQIVNRFTAIPALLKATGDGFRALANRDIEGMKQAAIAAGQAVIQLNTGLDPAQQKKIAEGIKGVAKEIAGEAKAAADLEKRMQSLRDAERGLKVATAERRAEVAALQLIAEDETLTFEKRGDAIKQANEIQKQQMETELALQRERVKITEQQLALGENLEEDENQLAEERAKLGEIEAASLKKLRSLKAKENSIVNQERAATVSHANKLRALTESQIKDEEDAASAKAAIREAFRFEQLTDLEKRKENALNKATELREAAVNEVEVQKFLSKELIAIHREEQDVILNEQLQGYEDFASAARTAVDSEIDDAELRKIALIAIAEKLLLAKQQALDLEVGAYTASTEMMGFVDEERNEKLLERKAEVDAQLVELEQQKADAIKDVANQLAADQIDATKRVMAQAQTGLAAIGGIIGSYADMIGSNIQAMEEQAKSAGKTEEQILKLTAKARKKEHKAKVAAAVVQTFQGALSAFTSALVIPPPAGPIIGAVSAAAALAFGFAKIGKMKQQKFDRGGVLKGASHAHGGIPVHVRGGGIVEGEDGEIVLTKGVYQNQALRQRASELNVAGGGIPLTTSTYMASGGVIAGSPTFAARKAADRGLTTADITRAMTEALVNQPAPIVKVTDINRINAQTVRVQQTVDL